jgi:hypothetical protein
MKDTPQNKSESVYDHCISVRNKLEQLLDSNTKGFILPSWYNKNIDKINSSITNKEELYNYAEFHDSGKPFCFIKDEKGYHFPNHEKISKEINSKLFNNDNINWLTEHDMFFHTCSANDVDSIKENKLSIPLLISSLAAIHANLDMFGGIDSLSFKIKWKQIDRRGNRLFIND